MNQNVWTRVYYAYPNTMNTQHIPLSAVKLSEVDIISETTRVIRYRRNFDFRAGQVVSITNDRSVPPRMYSIASGENEKNISILYKSVPEGLLTPRLDELNPGDRILVSKPFGRFLGNSDPACYIAAGTGIAPFMSMLRSLPADNKILIHGSRLLNEFYDSVFLEQKLGDRYIRCYSGERSSIYFKGRVTHYLESMRLPGPDYKYYLCGSAEMVVEVRQLLIQRGIDFANIHSEIYF